MTKDLSLKEKEFAEAFAKLYKNGVELAKLDKKSISTMIKFNEEHMKDLYNNEPLKIFKRKHQIWEKELEKLHTDLINLYKSYEETMNDYYDLIK